MNVKKRTIVILIIFSFLLGAIASFVMLKSFQGFASSDENGINVIREPQEQMNRDLRQINMTYDLIRQYYFQNVDEQELLEGAIHGMLGTLDDPYTSFMNEDATKRFHEQLESSFQGIGAEVSMIEGKVTIVAPIKDSPAEKAGLRPNDQILEVDQQSLDGFDLNEAVEKIRGEKGTEVVLLIQRQGATKPFEVTIVRDDIPLITVQAELEEVDGKKTGIISIRTFSETTAEEFSEALTQLEQEAISGLVIDVRGNPGGLLQSIEDILQHFVPKDIPYLQTEDRSGHREKYFTDLNEKKPYPINVVIDEGSASASEILAVALKEIGYDVIGMPSFGKGTVQQAIPLTDDRNGSTVKLTLYKWLSPKGNWIHEVGVEPTIEQKQPEIYYAHPITIEEPLTYDQTDEQVKHAQVLLKGIGYEIDREDGYFSEQMKQAVEQFQKDHDLKVTGEIDKETAFAIETKVMEVIRSGEQDLQLKKALDVLYP